MITLDTPRLCLRPVDAPDVDALFRHQSSPEVMRYVPGGVRTRAKVLALVELSKSDWRARGLGLFALVHKEIGEVIGYCGFKALEGGSELELDMILAEEHWTQGLGREAAAAVIADARTRAGLAQVLALPHDANVAAHRVCEEVGLAPAGERTHLGAPCVAYAL